MPYVIWIILGLDIIVSFDIFDSLIILEVISELFSLFFCNKISFFALFCLCILCIKTKIIISKINIITIKIIIIKFIFDTLLLCLNFVLFLLRFVFMNIASSLTFLIDYFTKKILILNIIIHLMIINLKDKCNFFINFIIQESNSIYSIYFYFLN